MFARYLANLAASFQCLLHQGLRTHVHQLFMRITKMHVNPIEDKRTSGTMLIDFMLQLSRLQCESLGATTSVQSLIPELLDV